MIKNPYLNAIYAWIYIVVLVSTINFVDKTEVNEGIAQYAMPILMLSLLTLSVAVMGYLFIYQPATLYLDGKKDKALKFFFTTLGTFALITLSSFLIFYLFIL